VREARSCCSTGSSATAARSGSHPDGTVHRRWAGDEAAAIMICCGLPTIGPLRHSGAGRVHRRAEEPAQDERGGDRAGAFPKQVPGCRCGGADREMSSVVRGEACSRGPFPFTHTCITVAPFMRMNGVAKSEAGAFVEAVKAQEAERTGESSSWRTAIFGVRSRFGGDPPRQTSALSLERMKARRRRTPDGCNEFESMGCSRTWKSQQRYMQRVDGQEL